MNKKRWMIGRLLLSVLVGVLTFVSGAWAALALWYQLPGGRFLRAIGTALWAVAVIALVTFAISRRSWAPLAIYGLALAIVLAWWSAIRPSNQRLWSDDVAQLMSGTISGSHVTLTNVRHFNWRTDADYDIRWDTRSYDLDQLTSADVVLSYWGSQAIAHAMISFGFANGQHVVFSVEIRKKRGQKYSPIGGFFKQFELVLTAADERDIIRVRTNVRGEDDYLYPLVMPAAAMRELFVSYVEAANRLVEHPAFYNTVTSNCTTIVYGMARKIDPGLPHDARLLLTGYLPGYLYEIGALDQTEPLDTLRRRGRITDRARGSVATDDFSKVIRMRAREPR